MKILIAADMEGITGVVHWDQVYPGQAEYPRFCKLMTGDVNAAIRGAFAGGPGGQGNPRVERKISSARGPRAKMSKTKTARPVFPPGTAARLPGAAAEEVPSPTFTLVQTYDMPSSGTLWHFDLYRLTTPEEALELGIEEAFAEGVSLIEWPERLGPWLPFERIDITLIPAGPHEMRRVEVRAWSARLDSIARALAADTLADTIMVEMVEKKDEHQA